jgi:2-polyprenyl-6-methoxyphenol hydroxylase-like FAD-dependent oxidoreductase
LAAGQRGSAIIVGGGIGGLSAAIALLAADWSVTVLDKHRSVPDAGSGISLWPNAMRVLDQLSLGDQVREVAAPLPAHGGLRTPSGRWLKRTNDGDRALAEVVLLHRGDLHRILLEALPPECVRSGVAVEELSWAESSRVTVVGRDGSGRLELTADLVVAADGMHSTLRRQISPEFPEPRYSGYTTWRGIAPSGAVDIDDNGETWGRGAKFGYLPLTEGRVYWFAELPALRDSALRGSKADDERGFLLRRFAGWHEPIPRLVAATQVARIIRTDVDYLPDLPTYVHASAVLLGDAAHGMPPDLGQGGCQALEDAAVLGAHLAHDELAAALHAYDEERRPRTQAIAKAARRMGQFSVLSNPAAVLARNALIRLTPARAAAGPLTRISRWAPPT